MNMESIFIVERVKKIKIGNKIGYKIERHKMKTEHLDRGIKVYPIDEQTGDIMGEVWFEMFKDGSSLDPRYRNMTRIFSIETYPNFQNHQVGGAMLDVVEYMSFKNGIYHIDGLYAPSNQFAEKMYRRNGYVIEDDYGEDKIVKTLTECPTNVTEIKGQKIEKEK